MVSHQPPCQIWCRKHCGSGNMFLVAEGKDSRSSCFNSPVLCISKRQGLKLDGIFTILATRTKQQEGRKREEKLECELQSFLRHTQTQ